jgi:uncharacterized membrane protein YoaK (UPF0700 family)
MTAMRLSPPLAEAWRTMVPAADDPHRPLPPLLLALTVVTGLVDAFSYLVLGHVFVANMTGNVVFLGFALAGASGFSLAASLVALAAFGLGALAGGRLSKALGGHRGHLLAVTAGVEACLVAASVGIAATTGNPGAGVARYLLIVLLAVATGAQNATARRLAVPDLTTTVLTLTITGIFADGRLAGGAASKIGRRLMSTASMFLGGLVGAVLVLHADAWLAITVAALVLVVVAATAATQARTDRAPDPHEQDGLISWGSEVPGTSERRKHPAATAPSSTVTIDTFPNHRRVQDVADADHQAAPDGGRFMAPADGADAAT